MITDFFKRRPEWDVAIAPVSAHGGDDHGMRQETAVTSGAAHPLAREIYDDGTTSAPICVRAEEMDRLLVLHKRRRLVCLNYEHCGRHLAVHRGFKKQFHAQHMPCPSETKRACNEERLTCSESFEHHFIKTVLARIPQLVKVTLKCACCRSDKVYPQPASQGYVEKKLALGGKVYSVDTWYTERLAYEVVKSHMLSADKYESFRRAQLHYPEILAAELIQKLRDHVAFDAEDGSSCDEAVERLRDKNIRDLRIRDASALPRVCDACHDSHKLLFVSRDCDVVFWQHRDAGSVKFFKGYAPFGKFRSFTWPNRRKPPTTVYVQQVDRIDDAVDVGIFTPVRMRTVELTYQQLPPEIQYHSERRKHLIDAVQSLQTGTQRASASSDCPFATTCHFVDDPGRPCSDLQGLVERELGARPKKSAKPT